MRLFVKSLWLIFLALLFIQLMSLPSYRTVSGREPANYPAYHRTIDGIVAIQHHQGNTVQGVIIVRNGQKQVPFSASESQLKGEAKAQLEKFDKLAARKKTLLWTFPLNLLLVFLAFIFADRYEKRHPLPGHSFESSIEARKPIDDYRASLNLKKEHAKQKRS